MPLYQDGYHIDCQQSLNAQYSLKPKVVVSHGKVYEGLLRLLK
jgi:hypothetical protein